MSFSKDDRVRSTISGEFAVVSGDSKKSDRYGTLWPVSVVSWRHGALAATKQTSWAESEMILDANLEGNPRNLWRDISTEKIVKIVSLASSSSTPGQYESRYGYNVQLMDGTNAQIVCNGARLTGGKQVQLADDNATLHSAVFSKIPLVQMPPSMRKMDVILAFRGASDAPLSSMNDISAKDAQPWESVFQFGFRPREEHFSPLFRVLGEQASPTGGIETPPLYDCYTPSAVCASHIPEGACLFPPNEKKKKVDSTWLYPFFSYEQFETCEIQSVALRGLSKAEDRQKYEQEIAQIKRMLLAAEFAIGRTKVPPETILGAFKIERRWNDPEDWTAGARLSIQTGFVENTNSFYRDDPHYPQVISAIVSRVKAAFETPTGLREARRNSEGDQVLGQTIEEALNKKYVGALV
jgi:hypothetical protein